MSYDDNAKADLEVLFTSAARYFAAMARAHNAEAPKDSAAFATLWASGGAQPGLRLMLTEPPSVEVGYVYKGEWAPFCAWRPEIDPAKRN